jgi:putative membrane protein
VRTLLFRFLATFIAVVLVARFLPEIFPNLTPPIRANDWTTILIFSAILALVNTFIRPILKILALPITCLTAGIFSIVINLLMFFLAAWITNQFLRATPVEVGWLGALIGAIAIGLVGWALNLFLPDKDEV